MASRKIEVQLVGDAGDLERSLAGALASLKAFGDGADKTGSKTNVFKKSTRDAERGLIDFDRAAAKVNKTMSGGPLGLFDAIGNVGYGLLKMGGLAQKAGDSFGNLFKGLSTGEAGLTGIGSAIGQLGPLLGIATGGFIALSAALLVLPAIAGAAVFVLTALLDVVTILSAAVVAFAGPLVVVTGLLGGLGAAFAFVAAQSIKNTATQQQVHDNLLALHVAQQTYNEDLAKYGKNATQTENALLALHKAQDKYETSLFGVGLNLSALQDKFGTLVSTLGKDFRPELLKLADAASQALTYLNRIAKLPLKEAFQSLATQGVAMLSKFVYGVANVLKKPFRLAIQIAFGSGGANAQSAIASWWNSLTNYLFGYTKTRPIHIGSMIVMDTKHVQGALQPLFDWFMRQGPQMVATGLAWSHDIINGLIDAWNHDKGLRNTVKAILNDAGHQAGRAFKAAFSAEIHDINWAGLAIWIAHQLDFSRALTRLAGIAFNAIRSRAGGVLGSIAGAISSKLGAAWSAVKSKATGIWNSIVGYVEGHVPHPHINFGSILKTAEGIWDSIVSYIESHIPHPTIHISIPTPSLPSLPHLSFPHTGGIVTSLGMRTMAAGGMVTGGIPGRDSVPALLTPGEMVLTRLQQARLLHGGGQDPVGPSPSILGGSYSRRRQEMTVSFTDAEASRLDRSLNRRSARRG